MFAADTSEVAPLPQPVFSANILAAVLPDGFPFDDVCPELVECGSSCTTALFENFELQQCPVSDEFERFVIPSWQHCQVVVDAAKCRLQKHRSSTVTMGRGTGEMAVTLTSFLLLTQVRARKWGENPATNPEQARM
ncbi:uncharacterized protein LOC144094101 [Amblyomma americanum]